VGPILNRLAGREYRISESNDGEWVVKWRDDNGDVVAWFGGDVRLIFMTLQHLADRTDAEFGIAVDRIWRREPSLTAELQALTGIRLDLPETDSADGAKRPQQK
jgi:hypothetical protein